MHRFSAILNLAAILAALTSALNETYDYIVVGGGLTGLVVANRLSEDSTSMSYIITAR
jgi:cation diffusion facilitator CzcD-associated flavoprotein CzcO